MGNSSTWPSVESEKRSWNRPHRLVYDEIIRAQQLKDLENFGETLQICDRDVKRFGKVLFQHWFITDGIWFFEFRTDASHIVAVRVHNNMKHFTDSKTGRLSYIVHKYFSMTEEVKRRMSKVCGAINYSLCLRNGEHLARYIHSGTWVSFQMAAGTGKIRKNYEKYFTADHRKLINTPPENIDERDEIDGENILYSECKLMVQFTEKSKWLKEYDDSNYSILFLGPTGSGKSRLINLLFNKEVSKSSAGALSVTRDVVFLKGRFKPIIDVAGAASVNQRQVNVIDTIGLCDSLMTKNEVYHCIKDKVKVNLVHMDVVVVVVSGRIEKVHADALKEYLGWLQYVDFQFNFVFVYNKADDLTPSLITRNLLNMGELLDIDITKHYFLCDNMESIDLTMATSFSPRAEYKDIKTDREKLINAIMVPRKTRIEVNESSCIIL